MQETQLFERDFAGCTLPEEASDPYEALLLRLKQDPVPLTVLWELTHKCNLDCIMCYNIALGQRELSTVECFDVLEQLAEAGTLYLTLTGGEILTRRDFFEIAEYSRLLGFALNLKTNGTLVTPEKADRIAALSPFRVDISLLGATNRTFDKIARSKDTLRRVVRGVKLLKERGVRVKVMSLLMDLNLSEREQMIDLVTGLGADYEQAFKISAADDGRDKAGTHQLSLEQMVQVLEADRTPMVAREITPSSRTCSVSLSSCLINPYGEVLPCIELRIPAGNLRTQRFAELWSNGGIFRQLRSRHIMKNLPDCHVCPINRYCEGRCSGLAFKEHGDLYGGHLLACQQAQARFASIFPAEPVPVTPLQARLNRSPVNRSRSPASQPIPLLDRANVNSTVLMNANVSDYIHQ